MVLPDALANAQAEALLLLSAAPQEPPRRKQHSAFLEGFSLRAPRAGDAPNANARVLGTLQPQRLCSRFAANCRS